MKTDYSFFNLVLALLLSTTMSAQIFSDDFGTTGGGTSSTSVVLTNQCFDGNATDYFGVLLQSEISEIYIGADGAFLAGQDMDASSCTDSNAAASWSNINIAGQTGLVLCLDIAEADDGTNQDWDEDSQVVIAVSVNGTAQTLGTITGQGAVNTFPGFDCNSDGVGDGIEITNAFTTFCFSINATGSSMDINIAISALDAGDEDIAIDNVEVYSNSNPTSTALNAACNGIAGCTDAAACNYNANATVNNSTCYNIGDTCDDGDATTINDVWTNCNTCTGTNTGAGICGSPTWEVISPTPNINAFNNNGEWSAIENGFSANGFCGGGCAEAVSTWLVYGPLNLSSTNSLNLIFDAVENFGTTDLIIAYTNNYSSACPNTSNWTNVATITESGAANINLSNASSSAVYIGIEYTDDGADGFSDWDLTNFQLLADVCPTVGTPIVSNCNTNIGCTNATACNYNASATIDDGSCFSAGDTCDDGDATTLNDVITNACVCEGTGAGLDNCGTPAWEVVSPTPSVSAFNNFGQWETIENGFSVNGFCGGDCVEPVSTWLIYGPLNMSNTSALNLVFDASENFGVTDLMVGYTANFPTSCPNTASWTTASTITETGTINVDLSGASGSGVYIGIEYTDDGVDGYSDWELTNFQLLANNCPAVGSSLNFNCGADLGCTDATACNFDPTVEIDDSSCINVGDTCDDGNSTTVNDVLIACGTCQGEPINPALCPSSAVINEFHYDNAMNDINEFVEITLPAGSDPTQIQVDLYNGSVGTSYEAVILSAANFVSTNGGLDYYVWYPTNIQNGNDGIAVSCLGGTLYQFITYEGAFMATDGPFAGEMGIDIGVSESSNMADTQSIMNDGSGNYIIYCIADAGAPNNVATCVCDPLINDCVMTCTQTINLNSGWNLISLDVSLADKTIQNDFGGLQSNNLQFITSFDNGALTYDPFGPPFLNTLKEVTDGFGYWVKVQSADVLIVEGDCIADNFRKPLDAGWNLVAYPPDAPQPPAMYFTDLISNNNLEFVTGFNVGTKTFNPNGPPFLNTILQMENGFGYWVKVSNPAIKKANDLINE